MFEDKRPGLFAMTLHAGFVQARHRQAAARLCDVRAVRIVALYAIHFLFEDRMTMWKVELGVSFQMAFEASRRVFAGIENKFVASAAGSNVQTAWAMTGFATARPGFCVGNEMKSRVGAGGKLLNVIRVTGKAGLIADKSRAGNFSGNNDAARESGAGVQQSQRRNRDEHSYECCHATERCGVQCGDWQTHAEARQSNVANSLGPIRTAPTRHAQPDDVVTRRASHGHGRNPAMGPLAERGAAARSGLVFLHAGMRRGRRVWFPRDMRQLWCRGGRKRIGAIESRPKSCHSRA